MLRWIPQQTRWSKSFYREFLYNIKSFYMHSAWMSVELVFQFVYPFLIILTLIMSISKSINEMMIVFFFVILMGTLRGCLGLARTYQLRFLHYGIYVFYYILCLIPSKIWAIITLWNNDWGTSSRFKIY
jgi:hyaluronan synthase